VEESGNRAASPGFADIDWSAPWLEPLAVRGGRWQAAALAGERCLLDMMNDDARKERIATGRGHALRFIPQQDLPPGTAYEAHIAATGCVPTRHNLHDFFNGLSWFQFPRIKAALNARGNAKLAQLGVVATRGTERDALTLFDENAALFACSDARLAEALRGFDWKTLFVSQRLAWGEGCEVRCFGHALIEKLVAPFKACTAHAWIVEVPQAWFNWRGAARDAWLDETVSGALLQAAGLTSRVFAPLPVLGIPGWWPENAAPSFYDDASVFRAGRQRGTGGARIAASKAGQAAAASPVSAGAGEESPDSAGQGDG
jgi:hypothetical protein